MRCKYCNEKIKNDFCNDCASLIQKSFANERTREYLKKELDFLNDDLFSLGQRINDQLKILQEVESFATEHNLDEVLQMLKGYTNVTE